MSLIQSPNDSWDALRKRHRLSDTTECRRAFYWGAVTALALAFEVVRPYTVDDANVTEYKYALERFKRERC